MNLQKYYVVVDTGYEWHSMIRIPETLSEELIVINHQSINLDNENTVMDLLDTISNTITMKHQRNFSNNPIFQTTNISSTTINRIINDVENMEYCNIWGHSHDIAQYSISPEIVLVHLKLKDVESG